MTWLDAAAPDEHPELNFLTKPVPRSDPLYRQYPPQKGLHVIKQIGGGLLMVYRYFSSPVPALASS